MVQLAVEPRGAASAEGEADNVKAADEPFTVWISAGEVLALKVESPL